MLKHLFIYLDSFHRFSDAFFYFNVYKFSAADNVDKFSFIITIMSLLYILCLTASSDVAQSVIGSCNIDAIAVKVATRVIGHYPHRNQLLIDAGFAAMSHDGKGVLPYHSTCVVQDHPELR